MRNRVSVLLVSFLLAWPGWIAAQGITIPEDNFTYEGTCPNAPPNYCDCVSDTASFAAAWLKFPGINSGSLKSTFSDCATNSGFIGWSAPFAYFRAKDIQMNYKDLAVLASALDPTKNAVNGTDENPLVVTMRFFTTTTRGKEDNTSFYVQLIAEEDFAPVTQTVDDPANPGQTIEIPLVLIHDVGCATIQNVTPSVPRRAIAFGFHGGLGGLSPKNVDCPLLVNRMIYYNVLYDGDHWMRLNENFPSSGAGIVSSWKWTYLEMTIKSTTIDLLVGSADGGWVTRTGVTRQYLGAFQKLVLGSSVLSDYPATADDVGLHGGELAYIMSSAAGACCKGDHTCEMVPQAECDAMPGATFKGAGVPCGIGEGRCCSDPLVDGDHDGDVDMVDFGTLQQCLTGTPVVEELAPHCRCFDTNDDGSINATEVEHFALCASGSGLQADASCDDGF